MCNKWRKLEISTKSDTPIFGVENIYNNTYELMIKFPSSFFYNEGAVH